MAPVCICMYWMDFAATKEQQKLLLYEQMKAYTLFDLQVKMQISFRHHACPHRVTDGQDQLLNPSICMSTTCRHQVGFSVEIVEELAVATHQHSIESSLAQIQWPRSTVVFVVHLHFMFLIRGSHFTVCTSWFAVHLCFTFLVRRSPSYISCSQLMVCTS